MPKTSILIACVAITTLLGWSDGALSQQIGATPSHAPTPNAAGASNSQEKNRSQQYVPPVADRDGYPERPGAEEQELASSEALYKDIEARIATLNKQREALSEDALVVSGQAAKLAKVPATNGRTRVPPPSFLSEKSRAKLSASLKASLESSCSADATRQDVLTAIVETLKSDLPYDEGKLFSQEDIRKLAAAGIEDPYEAIRPCSTEAKPSTVAWSLDGWVGRTCALEARDIGQTGSGAEDLQALSVPDIVASVTKSCAQIDGTGVYAAKRGRQIKEFYTWIDSELAEQQAAARDGKASRLAADAKKKNMEVAALDSKLAQLAKEASEAKQTYDRYLALRQAREAALARKEVARWEATAKQAAQRRDDENASGQMSADGRARCEQQTTLFRTVTQLAAVKAEFEGTEASSDWAIAELQRKGLSDPCIRYLSHRL